MNLDQEAASTSQKGPEEAISGKRCVAESLTKYTGTYSSDVCMAVTKTHPVCECCA